MKQRFAIVLEGQKIPDQGELMEFLHTVVIEKFGCEVWDDTEVNEYEGLSDQEKVIKIAEETDGQIYNKYSGRGMYGEKCMGIVHGNPNTVIAEAGKAGLKGAKTDGMGLQTIVYWERVPPSTEED